MITTALVHNTELLRCELEATIKTIQATVQAQKFSEERWFDQITLLQTEVEDERRHNVALKRALQVERVATAALERQVQQLQQQVAVLEKRDAILREAIAVLDALETSDKNLIYPNNLTWDPNTQSPSDRPSFEAFKRNYPRHHDVPIAEHLRPLLDILEQARKP